MILLVGAAAACFAVQEWVDGGVIAAIAVANVGLGVAQEARAEAALAALSALAATRAVVVRDGRAPSEVPAADLVPGVVGRRAGARATTERRSSKKRECVGPPSRHHCVMKEKRAREKKVGLKMSAGTRQRPTLLFVDVASIVCSRLVFETARSPRL